MLADKMKKSIDDGTVASLGQGLQILSYVIIATLAMWAWLIVKILLRLWRKNPMIHLWLPLWFGNLPFWILCVVPNAAFYAVTHVDKMPASLKRFFESMGEDTLKQLSTIGNSMSVQFATCAIISFCAAVAMFVFCFFYCPARRRMKRTLKAEKRAAKEAKCAEKQGN